MSDQADGPTDEFHYRPDLIRKRAVVIAINHFLIVLFAIWMTAMMAFVAWTSYEAEQQRDLLIDCTTPKGKCFEDSQGRTASVVGDLNRVAVYAAACADRRGVNSVADIEACVLEELERFNERNTEDGR